MSAIELGADKLRERIGISFLPDPGIHQDQVGAMGPFPNIRFLFYY
jgi:hypothetical protein